MAFIMVTMTIQCTDATEWAQCVANLNVTLPVSDVTWTSRHDHVQQLKTTISGTIDWPVPDWPIP